MLSPLFTQQPEERTRLHDELEEAKDKARRRSIGNIKFIGELFKLKMLTEAIMHDCVVKLLKNHDEESLECLCRLLTTIGKDLDFEKAKVRPQQRLRAALSQVRRWAVTAVHLPSGNLCVCSLRPSPCLIALDLR